MYSTPVDFRIIIVAAHQVLLERILDDEHWQVVLSVYVDESSRYDEWIGCDTAPQARDFIKTFPQARAHEFMARANDWWMNESARLARAEM